MDTHLRNSAMCKAVPPTPCVDPHSAPTQLTVETSSCLSESNTTAPSSSQPIALETCTAKASFDPLPKPILQLPSSEEDWEQADAYFTQTLVSQVLQQLTPDSKHICMLLLLRESTTTLQQHMQPSLKNVGAGKYKIS